MVKNILIKVSCYLQIPIDFIVKQLPSEQLDMDFNF